MYQINTLSDELHAQALAIIGTPKEDHRPSLRLLAWTVLKSARGQTVRQSRLFIVTAIGMVQRQPFHALETSQQAGILCNDARFQRFAAEACDCQGRQFNESAAAQFVRTYCKIASRRQLDSDSAAKLKFQILRTEFDAWTGKITSQPCSFWHADTLSCGRPSGCSYNQKTGRCE